MYIAEIQKYWKWRKYKAVKCILYICQKKMVLSKSIPGFTECNIRPCKEPKENASAQQMGMAIRNGNNTLSWEFDASGSTAFNSMIHPVLSILQILPARLREPQKCKIPETANAFANEWKEKRSRSSVQKRAKSGYYINE